MPSLPSMPICLVGGSSFRRSVVTAIAIDMLKRHAQRVSVMRVESPIHANSTWLDYDVSARVAHHEADKMVWYQNEILTEDPFSYDVGFVFCIDNIMTVYTQFVAHLFDVRKNGDQKALEETIPPMLGFKSLLTEVAHERVFFSGGMFLLQNHEEIVIEAGEPRGTPMEMETYIAKEMLDGMEMPYIKLPVSDNEAGVILAEYLIESFRLERVQDDSEETSGEETSGEEA